MTKTFNRNKPFQEVWGGNFGYRYVQDGMKFKHDGTEYVETASDAPAPQAAPSAPDTAATAAAEEAARVFAEEAGKAATAAALAERRAELQLEAFKLLQGNAEPIIAELADVADELLPVLADVEAQVKNRKTVIDGIAAEVKRREEAAAEEQSKANQLGSQLQ